MNMFRLLMFILGFSCSFSVRFKNVDSWRCFMGDADFSGNTIEGVYRVATISEIKGDDILYRENSEISSKWIINVTWKFQIDDFQDYEMHFYENINLVLEGVDTFATIYFNNQPLNTISNMFGQYILDVKQLYREEFNDITLQLHTPTTDAAASYQEYSATNKLIPECPPDSYRADCYVFMIRKMQMSFGSAVGPSIPSMGVWRPVYVEGFNDTTIRHIVPVLQFKEDHWQIILDVHFANNKKHSLYGSITITISDIFETNADVSLPIDVQDEFLYTKVILIPESDVKRWWPNGYGDQILYDMVVTFTSKRGEVTSKSAKIGFRTIELVQEELDNGNSFYFKVNDLPIFIKGSIMLPLSLQPELGQDRENITKLLSSARDQNMNMIRIWGGGVYQNDILYDIADELGLLIWQDFMFTDLSYPVDEDNFHSSVLNEAIYQVKRISSHPCLAVLCANDEGELALADNRYGINDATNKDFILNNYFTLVKMLSDEVRHFTHSNVNFVVSSPSNGIKEVENSISDDPNSLLYGDAHIFNYDKDPFDPTSYPIPRFCSSYGVQSIPSDNSFLKDALDFTHMKISGDFMQSRQHFPDGYKIMRTLIEHQLDLPDDSDDNWQHFYEAFIYFSQIIQAYSMRVQTELYRSYRNSVNTEGVGNTMGTIFWHLNDVWTAPTWSPVDFYGRWKMLQYYITDFFSPIIITGRLETNNNITSLYVYVVTDIEALKGVAVSVLVGKWSSLGLTNIISKSVNVEAGTPLLAHTIDNIDTYFDSVECTREDCFFYLKLQQNDDSIAADNFVLPTKLKTAHLSQPNIEFNLRKLDFEQIYEIIVTTDTPALFVWLDAHYINGYFSENGFLQTTATKKVFFYSEVVTSEEEMRKVLTLTHVKDEKYI